MKRFLLYFLIGISPCLAQLPIGTQRNPIYCNVNGSVVFPLFVTWSNQVNMTVPATLTNHLVRYQEFTNAVAGTTNANFATQSSLNTATNTVLTTATNLVQSKINGVTNLGISVTVTNAVNGFTNILIFGNGILTNRF